VGEAGGGKVKVDKTVERSIDTLQRVYAVIVALAISEGIKRTFLAGGSSRVEIHYSHLAEFVALIAIAVPFLHGMNRHLDDMLALIRKQNRRGLFVLLIFDFVVFLGEGCLLFLLAASVTSGVKFFQLLMVLLVVDVFWAFVTWKITKSVVIRWAGINGAMVAVSLLLIYCFSAKCNEMKTWVLAACAVVRTVVDYWLAWSFYFPSEAPEAGDAGGEGAGAAAAPVEAANPGLPP
jgi:hypothetical protein